MKASLQSVAEDILLNICLLLLFNFNTVSPPKKTIVFFGGGGGGGLLSSFPLIIATNKLQA